MEFAGKLPVAHGIRGAALAEIGAAADPLAAGQLDIDDRGHLLVAGGLGFGVQAELDLPDQFPDVAPVDHAIGEFGEPGPALDQQDRHAEFHAELGLQLVFRAVVYECVGHVAVGADHDSDHLPGLDVVLADQVEHEPHAGVGERAARVRLDRHAGEGERPRVAELALDRFRVIPAPRGFHETAPRLQHDGRRSPAEAGEIGGDNSAFGRAARVKRLGHGAEVLAQAGGLAGAYAQRAARLLDVEPEHAGRAGRRGNCADRCGRMEAVVVVPGVDGLRQLGFRLDGKLVGGEHVQARAIVALAQRQHRRQRRGGGVREQAVDPVFGNGELRVVVIIGVDGDAVRERGEARRHFHGGTDDGRALVGRNAERLEIGAHDAAGFRGIAGKREPQGIEYRALAESHDIGGDVGGVRVRHEFCDIGGERSLTADTSAISLLAHFANPSSVRNALASSLSLARNLRASALVWKLVQD